MKKYIAIATTALVALSACNKVTPDKVVEIDPEVSFQVAKHVSGTKADSPSAFDQKEMFGTFAIATDGNYDETTKDKVFFMDNQSIKYYEADKEWRAADKTYYWPKANKLSFISYAPYVAAADGRFTKVPAFNMETKTFTVESYNVKPVIKEQKDDVTTAGYDVNDLMYSTLVFNRSANDKTYNTTGSTTSMVPTLFHHMLSKVNLHVKVANVADNSMYTYGVIVKRVEFRNIYHEGSYSNANVSAGKTGTWTTSGTKVNQLLYSDTSASLALNAEFDGEGQNQILTTAKTLVKDYYVMPQSFKDIDDAIIVITYDLYTIKDGKVYSIDSITEDFEDGKYSTVKFNEMRSGNIVKDSWDENTIMNYYITISPGEPILFDPAVSSWDEVDTDYQIVVPLNNE